MPISLTERQRAWSVFTDAPETAATARRTADQQIEQITAASHWSDDHKRDLVTQQRAGFDEAVTTARRILDDARGTLLAAAGELSQPQGDTNAQLLAEMRQQRAWDRIRPQLEAGRPHARIIEEAVNARDTAAVLALQTEMPAWVQSRSGHPSGLAGLTHDDVDLAGLHQRLDVATYRTLGDDKGPGTAARLRLHVAAQYPLAVAKVEKVTSGRSDLAGALGVKYAQAAADAIEAQLTGGETADANHG